MRHQPIIQPVSSLEEERHARDEAEHGALVVTVQLADDDEERAGDEAKRVQQRLLRPDGARRAIRNVAEQAAERAEHDVQQPEHGRPVAALLQRKLELRAVVVAEDGVERELRPKRAEVARPGHEGLRGGEDV